MSGICQLIGLLFVAACIFMAGFLAGRDWARRAAVEAGVGHWKVIDSSGRTRFEFGE